MARIDEEKDSPRYFRFRGADADSASGSLVITATALDFRKDGWLVSDELAPAQIPPFMRSRNCVISKKNAGRGVGTADIARKWEGERRVRLPDGSSEDDHQDTFA